MHDQAYEKTLKEIRSSVDTYLKYYKIDTPEANLKKMEILKWTFAGFMILPEEENDMILKKLEALGKENLSRECNVSKEVMEQIKNSVSKNNIANALEKDTEINNKIKNSNEYIKKQMHSRGSKNVENDDTKKEDDDETEVKLEKDWIKKLERIKKEEELTPLKMFEIEVDKFTASKKYSSYFEKLPIDMNQKLESLKNTCDEEEIKGIYNNIVEDLIEGHKLDHRFPLINTYNNMSFRWMEFTESIGHFQDMEDIKPCIKNVELNLDKLPSILKEVYKKDPKINGEFLNLKENPITATKLSNIDCDEKNKELKLLISAKNKASIIKKNIEQIGKIEQEKKYSLENNKIMAETADTLHWLQELKEKQLNGINSGVDRINSKDLSLKIMDDERFNKLQQNIDKCNSIVSDNAQNTFSKFENRIPKLPDVNHKLLSISRAIDCISSSLIYLQHNCTTCNSLKTPSSEKMIYGLDSEVNKLRNGVNDFSSQHANNLTGEMSKINDLSSELVTGVGGKANGLYNEGFDFAQNKLNMPSEKLNELEGLVTGLTNSITGRYCSISPFSLFSLPRFNFGISFAFLLNLLKILSLLISFFKINPFSFKMFSLIIPRLFINFFNLIFPRLALNLRFTIPSLILRLLALINIFNLLINMHINCCPIVNKFLINRNMLLEALGKLKGLVIPLDRFSLLNPLDLILNNIFKMHAFSFPIKSISLMGCLAAAQGCLNSIIKVKNGLSMQKLGMSSSVGRLYCQYGTAPFPYQITPTGEVYGPGKTIGSILAFTLWPSCGGCTNPSNPMSWETMGIPPYPCIANLHTPFSPGSSQIKVLKGMCNALIVNDKCTCLYASGGQIWANNPGQYETKFNK